MNALTLGSSQYAAAGMMAARANRSTGSEPRQGGASSGQEPMFILTDGL
jgi:hypothetical protein